jgi:hypothetical protein
MQFYIRTCNPSAGYLKMATDIGGMKASSFPSFLFTGRVWSSATCPTPIMEDQGIHIVWPLHFDFSGMEGSTKNLWPISIALQVTGAHSPTVHDNAVFLENQNIGI